MAFTGTLKPPATAPADLIWQDGVPESARFGDVYFNRDDGLAETRHVFINPNRLPDRFGKLSHHGQFVIGETGFGSGLSFLTAWADWKQQTTSLEHTVLHFVSFERYPLTREQLQAALARWPELSALSDQLIRHYPPLMNGVHRLVFEGGKVRLTLFFGEVLNGLGQLSFQADAWFLDGFDPQHNPEMWSDEVMQSVRTHSRPGTTFATFTAVGRVRRSLEAAGFEVRKLPGFGRKREMLSGTLATDTNAPGPVDNPNGPVAIIGAGIAGTLLARNLAERGLPVLLIDKAAKAGSGASGNAQGALYAKLGIEYNAQAELAATALAFSQRYYRPWQGDFWHPTGLLQLATTEKESERQRKFCERNQYPGDLLTPVTANQASELAGIEIPVEGLWFPQSGWLEPAKACDRLSRHPLITTLFDFEVHRIGRLEHGWCIQDIHGTNQQVSKLVIACGHQTAEIAPVTGTLRLKPIRGQVTYLPESTVTPPATVICGSKYLNPVAHGQATTGATFDIRNNNPELTAEGHQENLDELLRMLPKLPATQIPSADALHGRVAFRCTTHDYQPVAGELRTESGDKVEGAYLFTGLGSKGLVWGPLLAEYLGDLICEQPLCLPSHLTRRVETHRLYPKREAGQ
ncbi:bifunctional tRNA (5-methylaminomethyl-2-thiouridine)(34)-methyltransferase MnmD/FAD-dependent 5-carboxymethylaminomethyl-2-thiouridine(34) oxidoreductase MnmC [Marinobacter litoralis]|uniref:bifunctional tRNA (5-methylaminomethyl-2-thiouridine)(34)-methyltransferase MnmD/FAD-dependent 5-carboxymethylaminomethyl-2-thiouridine(34) oxidoreductase MnmC n=1 Tax=Marinobacter litoralis TaxID=187981 RepID=UPI0018EDC9D4|nr:bifunctional tRNA (5-methylaminomethyl-2-thiouridine)(34)-methyltransferase MnmD/FAD-dependent 5-carboxymethylaminomethyl-2-thiouridine(34) oxidoreductase MnmC [Marinobacter litoralis]MBJ6138008.1 bifunctional tRNA (5-methylaminomethyl-2-thiouridine)(34)-methyltransferase MnmD/FAD-dependent 5-carboxymethylaminomethyl-2-thiouridine(34) oxidoreductase MnmC [Marinobacter litoralis]